MRITPELAEMVKHRQQELRRAGEPCGSRTLARMFDISHNSAWKICVGRYHIKRRPANFVRCPKCGDWHDPIR